MEAPEPVRRMAVPSSAPIEGASKAQPDSSYTVVCTNGVIDVNGIDQFQGSEAVVAPMSALIFHN